MIPLSLAEVRTAAVAAIENARDLVSDAEVLFEKGRFPSSFSMGILAAEELGKTAILVGALDLLITGRPVDWERFDKRLHSHRAKLRIVGAMDQILELDEDEEPDPNTLKFGDAPKLIDTGKQYGFYVWIESGKIRIPKKTINREMAADALQGVRGTITLFDGTEPYIRGETNARTRERFAFIWLRLLDQMFTDFF